MIQQFAVFLVEVLRTEMRDFFKLEILPNGVGRLALHKCLGDAAQEGGSQRSAGQMVVKKIAHDLRKDHQ